MAARCFPMRRPVTTDGSNPGKGGICYTGSSGAFSDASGGAVAVTNLSGQITSTGRVVRLELVPVAGALSQVVFEDTGAIELGILTFQWLRDGVVIGTISLSYAQANDGTFTEKAAWPPGSFTFDDIGVAAGTYTYSVKVSSGSTSATVQVTNCRLKIKEEQ